MTKANYDSLHYSPHWLISLYSPLSSAFLKNEAFGEGGLVE